MASPPATNPHAEWLSAEKIEDLVHNFYGTKTLMVDRAVAEALLRYNKANRKINRRKLGQLVEQMRASLYENTGEPVIISDVGIMNDGQHRLLAVVEADATVDIDVRFGIPRKVFSKTDTGAARTPGDVLTIKGVISGSQVSSTVRLLLLYERGLPDCIRDFVSNDEVARGYDRWHDIQDIVAEISQHPFPKVIRSTPLYATAFLASRAPGKSKLPRWMDAVATGLEVARDDPAYQLRERLMRGIDAPIGTREGQLERFALMIKSWNLWQKGESVTMREFRWVRAGKNPEPFPKVPGAKL